MLSGGYSSWFYPQSSKSTYLDLQPKGIWNGMWLGSNDDFEEGVFVWRSNYQNLTFTNWNDGEPNDNRDQYCKTFLS